MRNGTASGVRVRDTLTGAKDAVVGTRPHRQCNRRLVGAGRGGLAERPAPRSHPDDQGRSHRGARPSQIVGSCPVFEGR